MREPSNQANRAAAALLEQFDIRDVRAASDARSARDSAKRKAVAELIDREVDLPELLAQNARLCEIKDGAFQAARELYEQNRRLRDAAERAERWIVAAAHAKPGTSVGRLDLAGGRSLVDELARARGALKGTRKRRSRARPSSHRYPGS